MNRRAAKLLLLSGGVDSTALAAWLPCDAALTIDYGQLPAVGEINAATSVAGALSVAHDVVTVDASAVGSGLLAGSESPTVAPSAEWWPFRNQLLVTIAAAYAIGHDFDEVIIGSVAGDGVRHHDGTPGFYDALAQLIAMQEGGIRVTAPAAGMTAIDLLNHSGISLDVLAWTHSCHRSDLACGDCPGCWKRAELLAVYQQP